MTLDPSGAPRGVHATRVAWIDTDACGIYHHSTVIRYLEAAEGELMRSRGITGYCLVAPRRRLEVDFTAPLRHDDHARTTVVLEEVGHTTMTFSFEVRRDAQEAADNSLVAHGRYVTVHVVTLDPQAGTEPQSSPWPRDWVAALER